MRGIWQIGSFKNHPFNGLLTSKSLDLSLQTADAILRRDLRRA
jgi:hypothetical protein